MLLLEENDQPVATGSQLSSTLSLPTPLSTAKFKPKSQRFPDLMTNPNVWAFLSSTVNDIKRMTFTPTHNNLTQPQLQAIQKRQNHPDLEIKAADKRGNIVLMT